MNRRLFLAGFPAAVTTLVGCFSVGALTTMTTDGRVPPTARGNLRDYDPGMSLDPVEIGATGATNDGESPGHTVSLWNTGIRLRPVAVVVTDRDTDEAVLDTTFELPIDPAVDVAFHERSTYDATIRLWKAGVEEVLRVPAKLFNCGHSGTQIGIFAPATFGPLPKGSRRTTAPRRRTQSRCLARVVTPPRNP